MKNKFIKYTLLVLPGTVAGDVLYGQAAGGGSANPNFYDNLLATTLVVVASVVLIASLAALVRVLNIMVQVKQIELYKSQGIEPAVAQPKPARESLLSRWYKKLTAAVPVEKEEDILFEHEYDGIRELDNSLPPWWVYMFYITIIFAAVYMTYYHFTDYGLSSREQYALEMEQAEEQVQAYLARQGDNVDETNVTMLEDGSQISLGKSVFEMNCAACHGMMGEGGVGPNLTDDYWLHGGTIKDIFKTIKYGVPEKGMIAWKSQLSAKDMHRVASYIVTLHGTNPPNAKEPQGEKVQAQETNGETQDSTSQAQAVGLSEAEY